MFCAIKTSLHRSEFRGGDGRTEIAFAIVLALIKHIPIDITEVFHGWSLAPHAKYLVFGHVIHRLIKSTGKVFVHGILEGFAFRAFQKKPIKWFRFSLVHNTRNLHQLALLRFDGHGCIVSNNWKCDPEVWRERSEDIHVILIMEISIEVYLGIQRGIVEIAHLNVPSTTQDTFIWHWMCDTRPRGLLFQVLNDTALVSFNTSPMVCLQECRFVNGLQDDHFPL